MHEVRERWPADALDKGPSFSCSSGQRRLWILHELDPHNPALNLTQRWRVAGKLSHAHPEKVFQNLLARHAVLKTLFAQDRNPLLSVNFHFQESSLSRQPFGNFSIVEVPCCSCGALYELNFILRPYLLGWRISDGYNRDLFKDQTIVSLLQAEHTPSAIAVVCGTHSMTYQELNSASSRLAQLLQERGLAPATRIRVFLNRSTEFLVAVLTVLKSGSAYIPLDTLYPAERLAHVFENSRPAAVITHASQCSRQALGRTPAVVVDAQPESSITQTAPSPSHTPPPKHPAYLNIYIGIDRPAERGADRALGLGQSALGDAQPADGVRKTSL